MRRFLVNRFIRFVIGSIAYHHLRTTFLKSWIIRMYGGRIAKQVFGHVFPCADIDLLTFRGGSVSGGGAQYNFETAAQVRRYWQHVILPD